MSRQRLFASLVVPTALLLMAAAPAEKPKVERMPGHTAQAPARLPDLAVFVNQGGYNRGESKRFTCPEAADGTTFRILPYTAPAAKASGRDNRARTARVTESGSKDETTFPPSLVNDGVITIADDTTRWLSEASVPHWVQFDWDAPQTIDHLRVVSGWSEDAKQNSMITDFSLQQETDGQWVDVPGTAVTGNKSMDADCTFGPVTAKRVRLVVTKTIQDISRIYEVELDAPQTKPVKPAEAAPTAPTLYHGKITAGAGDFTDFNPDAAGTRYVIEVEGHGQSAPFWIADHLMEKLSSRLAYQFFIDVRGGTDPRISPAKITGGGPSRDGGGQTLEATYEVLFYASNPALFTRWTDEKVWDDQNPPDVPDLIELILWHAAFCYDKVDYQGRSTSEHPKFPDYARWRDFGYEGQPRQGFDRQNMLDQLAAVCAAYHSFLKPHMDEATYRKYRQACLDRWEEYDRQKEVRRWVRSTKWVDVGYKEFNEMGCAFGQGLLRNLLMYLCEKNEPDGKPERFLKYARECAQDIIDHWDFDNPWHMWAMRNAEHITPQALGLFLLIAPDEAPRGSREKLAAYRDYLHKRTDNLWNYRTHSDTEWAHPKSKEIGTVGGLGGSMFLTAHLLDDAKLRGVGWSQVDFVFGRNPIGCHTSNKAPERVAQKGYWEGVTYGWPYHFKQGTGELGAVRGTLDGSPTNAAFPFNPKGAAGDSYATEGWAITNRAWMSTLTFSTLGSHRVRVLDAAGQPIANAKAGDTVTVELKAALNQDWNQAETGWVEVAAGAKAPQRLTVTETGPNTGLFTAAYKLDLPAGTLVRLSYGYLGFTKTATVTVGQ